jgi:nicotinate-nucleotide--dimethylbenzimidazole phosphoribosyltransferase
MAGPGTGLDDAGVAHKRAVIAAGLSRHRAALDDPLEVLRRLGGFEIAALVSAYLHAAAGAIPVLVDGFIASVAALLAVGVQAAVGEWLFYAHRSAELGHGQVLGALGVRPLLDLGMRLGEGSGAGARGTDPAARVRTARRDGDLRRCGGVRPRAVTGGRSASPARLVI